MALPHQLGCRSVRVIIIHLFYVIIFPSPPPDIMVWILCLLSFLFIYFFPTTGKTTLMDCLAMRKQEGVMSGEITVNGHHVNPSVYKTMIVSLTLTLTPVLLISSLCLDVGLDVLIKLMEI